jgi:hypothetical protein
LIDQTTGTGRTSFLAFVDGNDETQTNYIRDLLGRGIFFLCLVVLWLFTLLILKCSNPQKFGCATGRAFSDCGRGSSGGDEDSNNIRRNYKTPRRSDDDEEDISVGATPYHGGGGAVSVLTDDFGTVSDDNYHNNNTNNKTHQSSFLGTMFGGGAAAAANNKMNTTTTSTTQRTSSKTNGSKNKNTSIIRAPMPNVDYDSDGCPVFDDDDVDDIANFMEPEPPFQHPNMTQPNNSPSSPPQKYYNHQNNILYSLPKQKRSSDDDQNDKNHCQTCCSDAPSRVAVRKFRTRVVYGFFALISLAASALLLTEMYYPLEESAQTTALVVQDTKQVVREVDVILANLTDTATVVQSVYDTIPSSYPELCPNFDAENFAVTFGFDPQSVMDAIFEEYSKHITTALTLLKEAQAISNTVAALLGDVDTSLQKTQDHLWVIPLMICCSMFVTFALSGLMIAVSYKEHTHKDIQAQTPPPSIENWFGWTLLPLQLLVVLVSWGLVVSFCFGTLLSSDSCIPSSVSTDGTIVGVGTPEDTVVAVLNSYTQGLDESLFERLETYILGCQGEDPLAEVDTLKSVLSESLELVSSKMDLVEVIGISNMETVCGEGNEVQVFFENVEVVQDELVRVEGSLTAIQTTLACPRLNELYIRAMHNGLCTEFATANAFGFLLFLVVSFSGMILISLRAAWRTSS